MVGIYVFTAVALVVTGVVIGAIAVVSLGIRREGRLGRRLPADTDDRIARGARQLTGLYVHHQAPRGRTSRRQQDTTPV